MEVWRKTVRSWFPDLHNRTHCVPPVYFMRVAYDKATIAGQTALLARKPDNTDSQDASRPGLNQQGASEQSSSQSNAPSGPSTESASKTAPQKTSGKRQSKRARRDPSNPASQTKLNNPTSNHHTKSSPASASNHAGSSTESHQASQAEPGSVHNSDENLLASAQQDSYSMWTCEATPPLRTVQIFDSDTRDDFAQQHVLHCLQELGRQRQEVMFVLSQLNFSDYLNKPAYAAAAAELPLPTDLHKDLQRGDFDVILIHRHHGIVLGEIKAIGLKDAELNKGESEADAVVGKRIERAIKQLNKSEKMVSHLAKDIAPGLSVKKTLILPYVTTSQLQRVLSANPRLEQTLTHCLGLEAGASVCDMCLCSEQLSSRETPWHLSSTFLSELEAWWERRVTCSRDPAMSDDVYVDLIARFCGPATTVSVHCVVTPRLEVRTLWEAVSEVGERISRLVVTPEQQDLLTRLPDTVCLTGPPGTGKSVCLVLVGLQWLRQGQDVHVVSTNHASLAASLLIFHQLQLTLQADVLAMALNVSVVFHDLDFLNDEGGVEAAVKDLVGLAKQQRLCVLMDESAFTDDRMTVLYQRFLDGLSAGVPRLSLWAAAVRHASTPTGLQVEPLTAPLRSAPAIVREIEQGTVRIQGLVHEYKDGGTASPCDGLKVIRLRHEGKGHVGDSPVECFLCGQEVARTLRQLRVGVDDDRSSTTSPEETKTTTETRPPPLQYRDVFILTRSSTLHDDVRDAQGHVVVEASGVVLGLRSAGIPVHVIRTDDIQQWREDVADVAIARSNQVMVTWYGTVFGLERKVVVCLPGRWHGVDHQRSFESVDALDRLLAVSRCTAQLIHVDVPRDNSDVTAPREVREDDADKGVVSEKAEDPDNDTQLDESKNPELEGKVEANKSNDRMQTSSQGVEGGVPPEGSNSNKESEQTCEDASNRSGDNISDEKEETRIVVCTKLADLWPRLFTLSEL